MATRETLGVAIVGAGWCASQHIAAFQRNPRTRITWICGRDLERTRAAAASAGAIDNVRITTDFEAVLAARDVDIVSITTPNHLHADQAVAAAKAGKHIVLEKPTGLDAAELVRIRDAVRSAGVRTIVSFELHYNPYLKFARWLRAEGWLGAHALFVPRHRLVGRLELGSHPRERPQPPARRRLPCCGCASVLLGTRGDHGERAPHALHRGL